VEERSEGIGWDLADWGRVVLLETIGRKSGRARTTPVGFVEQQDGSLLVAANDDYTHWAQNLLVHPRCRVTREGRTLEYLAEPLAGPDHQAAVTALILRYGTPAERLGAGPSFRLRPAGRSASAPEAAVS
jgi:deazaflavin-dependent oxidoreductase (nitroreductase family)